MPSIATTTLEQIEPRLVAVIEALTPVPDYQRAAGWKHYANSKKSPGRTRSFTIRWVPGQFVVGGYFTSPGGGGVETAATLLVVTDYVGQAEKIQWLVQRDYQQLRDALNVLTADISTGVVSVLPTRAGSARVASTPQARTQVSNAAAHDAGAIQVNHTLALTYQLERIAS
ncbi:MAG TPA: hypothetical protein VFH61_16640 [Thermoleophilia bacterium]|nr:hypothetical protein [Thermoleophilia bacterium]